MTKWLQGVVAHRGVTGDGLHDPNLSGSHVVGKVLVVGVGSGQEQEDCMTQEGDAMLHTHHHLLPHPLGDQVVAEDDDGRPNDEPDRKQGGEGVVETGLKTKYSVMKNDIQINFVRTLPSPDSV